MPILGIKSIENSHILEDFLLISCCSFVLKSSLVYSEKQKTWANLNFKETEIYLGYFWEAAWKGIDVERRCFHTLVSKPGNLCSNSWKSFALRSLPTEWFTVGLPSPYLSPQLSLASGQTTRWDTDKASHLVWEDVGKVSPRCSCCLSRNVCCDFVWGYKWIRFFRNSETEEAELFSLLLLFVSTHHCFLLSDCETSPREREGERVRRWSTLDWRIKAESHAAVGTRELMVIAVDTSF